MPNNQTTSAPRRRRTGLLAIAVAVFSVSLTGSGIDEATAQTAIFPASDYGNVELRLRESIGGAATAVLSRGHAFEPLDTFDPNSPMSALSRAVGRLDLQVRREAGDAVNTCTATLVSPTIILTNHHCAFPFGGTVTQASLVLDFLTKDGERASRIAVQPRPLEADQKLDYALMELVEAAPRDIRPVQLTPVALRERHSFRIIHHPAGQPKVVSRFQCAAAVPAAQDPSIVRHTCDTLPGSSGALILDDQSLQAVGIHHTGGLRPNDPTSFNSGTTIAQILARSVRLRELAGGSDGHSAGGGASGTSATASTANDVIGEPSNVDGAGRADTVNELIGSGLE